ncbi:MAG: hypothetical protein IKF49_07925 [Clostridia bacterium]|nr:hypothetical protein [Clostridia bacterium]
MELAGIIIAALPCLQLRRPTLPISSLNVSRGRLKSLMNFATLIMTVLRVKKENMKRIITEIA